MVLLPAIALCSTIKADIRSKTCLLLCRRIGNDPGSAGAVAAILFLWSMLTAFTSMGILPTIVLERPVYTRERADGLYLPITYCIYKLVEELAPQIPAGLAYSALVFYLVALRGSFLLFWLVYLVSTANAIGEAHNTRCCVHCSYV